MFPSSEENRLPELQKSPLHIHSGLFCVFPRISIFYAMFRSRFFYCRVWDGNRCTRETLPVKSPPNHFDGLLVLASVYFPRPLPAKYFRRYVGLTAVFGMGTGVPPPPSTPTMGTPLARCSVWVSFRRLAPPVGLEPTTFRLTAERSTKRKQKLRKVTRQKSATTM